MKRRHRLIVIYKTAFYSFYLPVALAMYMSKIPKSDANSDVRPYEVALSILIPLGEYFQIQDDFLDFSADPEILGKIGTDIMDNKCSWCINMALKLGNEEDRRVLYENYGRKDGEKERKVKEVFERVGIWAKYEEYERQVYLDMKGMIERQVPSSGSMKREVFTNFLEKIYK